MSEPRRAASWDTGRPPRRGHGWLVLGLVLLVPGVIAVLLRLIQPSDDAAAMVASLIPYGMPFTVLALGGLLVAVVRSHRRPLSMIAAGATLVLVVVQVGWRLPDFVPDREVASTAPFTLMSLNVRNGQAAPAQVWAQAEQSDIVIMVETSDDMQKALAPFGWNSRFPYAVGNLDVDASDTAIYSRFPLGPGTLIDTTFQQWETDVDVPQVGSIRLFGVHPCNPYCGNGRWRADHALLSDLVARTPDQPTIMAGDFNAIDDHRPMRDLRRLGLRNAADVAGSGWLPTWPADRAFPPVIGIDHIMISHQLTASSVRAFTVAGSDHRGLVATLAGRG